MNDRDRQSLLDIINSANLATDYLAGTTRDEFLTDRILQDAIVRRIEVAGEAARRLSDAARNELDDINWPKVVGMRNIMIHQYDRVNFRLVWETATEMLPELARKLETYLEA
ncbi:MAG: DUF86 domain-containing protein [Geitlerinemataceae cyanobacterium]